MSEPTQNDNQDSAKKTRTCQFCKNENPEEFLFCSNCGSSLSYKVCTNCYSTNPMNAKFCFNCGGSFAEKSQLPYRSNQTQYTYVQPIYPPPYNYTYTHYYQKPKWWNLPVFFVIFCIFGLIILASLITLFSAVLFGMTGVSFQDQIYLDMATKIVQLAFIVFALKYFRGFHFFFSKNNSQKDNSQDVTDEPRQEEQIKKKMNIITKFLFILLFVFILLVIDLYTDVIISFLREFFKFGSTTSSYSFLDTNFSQYFLLITFWVVIFAPIHEEILFRGILQQALDKSSTSDFSHYIIQGLTFAFMHLAGDILNGGSIDFVMLHMISTFTFAVASTYLRKKFNSLIPSILLHSFSNGLSLSFTFLTTSYFTTDQLNLITILIYILPIFFIIGILIIFYLLGHWKLKKPLSLTQDKSKNFIFRILVLAGIFNIFQYGFILVPSLQSQFAYIIVFAIISLLMFILWGSRVKDLAWNDIKKYSD